MDRKTLQMWGTVAGSIATPIALIFTAWATGINVSLAFTVAAVLCAIYATGMLIFLGCYYRPSLRRRREFKAEAKAVADGLSYLARVYQEEERNSDVLTQGYTDLHLVLRRIRQKFGIRVPVDPYDLVLRSELQNRLAEMAAFAESGDLEAARRLFEEE